MRVQKAFSEFEWGYRKRIQDLNGGTESVFRV